MRTRRVLALACAALVHTGCSGSAPITSAGPPDMDMDPRFAELAQAIEKDRVRSAATGAAVAVLAHGELVYAAGFGTKAPDSTEPIKPTTLFRIGSLTKMMTAIGVLQLVESGQVSLDAPVVQYVPGFHLADDAWAPGIKVRNLLDHTSALYDYMLMDGPRDDRELDAFFSGPAAAQAFYLLAPTGRMYNYANPNFMLAGLIVEKVSGLLYRGYMHDRVFAPLGMNRTYFLPSEVLADGDYAIGTTRRFSDKGELTIVTPDRYDNAWARPCAFAFSSVLDMAHLARFLLSGSPGVLGDAERAMMESAQVPTDLLYDFQFYGFGLGVQEAHFNSPTDFRREHELSHSGLMAGATSYLILLPRTGFAIVILSSGEPSSFSDSLHLAMRLFGELPPSSPPPANIIDARSVAPLVGVYDDPYRLGAIFVTRQGSQLQLRSPVLDNAMVAYDKSPQESSPRNYHWTIDGTDNPITFLLDGSGKPEYLRSRYFVARYMGAGPAKIRPPEPRPFDRAAFLKALHSADHASEFSGGL